MEILNLFKPSKIDHPIISLDKKRGFTLVEILVVISIIALISSVISTSLVTVRAKARNARRLADVHTFLTALSFFQDSFGEFPCHSYITSTNPDFLSVLIQKGYLNNLPKDPLHPIRFYAYTSYKEVIGGPCGKFAHIDVDFEPQATVCPYGKFITTLFPEHCHVFYPGPLPPPCTPYDDDHRLPGPQCPLADSVNKTY